MRTIVIILLSAMFYFGLIGCVRDELRINPSGNITTQSYPISDFDELVVQDLFEVYIKFSDSEESLVIEADDNIHHLVEINRRNGTLSIGLEDRVNIRRAPTLRAYLTTSNLHLIEASGAASIILENEWVNGSTRIELSGASHFEGSLNVDHLSADLSGASKLSIVGKANQFNLEASGASHFRDTAFECDYLKAELSGASSARLKVNYELNVEASGGSTMYFLGDGVITRQDLSGGSSIIRI